MKDESRTIDAFGIVHDVDRTNSVDLSNPFVPEWGLEYDKETGSTRPVITGKLDFVEAIQTFKDQCGVEAAMRDVATGRRTAASVADDGQHGGDFSRSSDVIESYESMQRQAAASVHADEKAREKGIDPKEIHVDGLDLETYIQKQVSARMAAALPQTEGDKK